MIYEQTSQKERWWCPDQEYDPNYSHKSQRQQTNTMIYQSFPRLLIVLLVHQKNSSKCHNIIWEKKKWKKEATLSFSYPNVTWNHRQLEDSLICIPQGFNSVVVGVIMMMRSGRAFVVSSNVPGTRYSSKRIFKIK